MCLRILALLLLGALSACSMAPHYVRPESPVEDAWPQSPLPLADKGTPADPSVQADNLEQAATNMSWQQFFTDPHLRHLLQLALDNNRDLRVAVLNIEKARGMYQIQRADLLPTINATGQSATTGLSEDLSPTGKQTTTYEYSANLGTASFELDFFGRVQSLKDEALEKYLSTEEARKAAQISLVSNVASAYLTLLADRERLKLASDTLISQQDTYGMTKKRYELGVASELDLRQAQISVDTARVDIARYTGQVALDQNALSVLTGIQIKDELLPQSSMANMVTKQELFVGLPSNVLLQRPDILQAEHTLKAANANIGAARANFFPRISLTASTGTGSDQLSHLFMGPTGTWAFIPQVSLPIFQGGRNIATLRVSEADKSIAVANYEKAIQVAFQEVADALVQKDSLVAQVKAQESLTHATSEAYRLSYARYNQGIDSYLNVLDSQRSFYTAQFALVSVQTSKELNRVNLYKALGGGWR